MEEMIRMIRQFNKERDWEQYHTPENLAKSISIEAGELLECFQWSPDYKISAVKEELADVMIYCLMLADKTGIDIPSAIKEKIALNAAKYPVEKAKGSSKKYTELEEKT